MSEVETAGARDGGSALPGAGRVVAPGGAPQVLPVQMGCCGPTALWGWSPPSLPADTPLKQGVDRLLPRTGAPAVLFYIGVIALLSLAPHLPKRGELVLDGLAALAAGGWCALNYWRCRHAHCVVTGAGWLALGVFTLFEVAVGRSLIGGDEQLVFLGVLAVALLFEGGWWAVRGSNALGR